MQLILLERVAKLGQMGDVVKVRDGYARNFLLPQGKALRATPDNMKRFEDQRAQFEVRNLEQRKEAEAVAAKMEGLALIVVRQAAATGQLYGSVSTRDLAETLTGEGFSVGRGQIELHEPIKSVGIHTVVVSLHPEVEVPITVNVARSVDEAERQARGEDLSRRDEGFVFEEEEEAEETAGEPAEAETGGATATEE